jgi:hypothetical protein
VTLTLQQQPGDLQGKEIKKTDLSIFTLSQARNRTAFAVGWTRSGLTPEKQRDRPG